MGTPIEPKALAQTGKDKASIGVALLAVVIALLALWLALQKQTSEKEEARAGEQIAQENAAEEESEKVDLAQQVRESCVQGGEVAAELGSLCNQATQIVRDEPGLQGPQGPPPSEATVTRIVQNVIASRPNLVTSAVEDIVVDYLVRNPPADGETPTRAEVREVVEDVYAASPPPPGEDGKNGTAGSDGTDGAQGPPGETPTFQITDAGDLIATYPSGRIDNLGNVVGTDGTNGEKGEPGKEGPQGPPGPTCPDGYQGQEFTVETGQSVTADDTRPIFACVPASG